MKKFNTAVNEAFRRAPGTAVMDADSNPISAQDCLAIFQSATSFDAGLRALASRLYEDSRLVGSTAEARRYFAYDAFNGLLPHIASAYQGESQAKAPLAADLLRKMFDDMFEKIEPEAAEQYDPSKSYYHLENANVRAGLQRLFPNVAEQVEPSFANLELMPSHPMFTTTPGYTLEHDPYTDSANMLLRSAELRARYGPATFTPRQTELLNAYTYVKGVIVPYWLTPHQTGNHRFTPRSYATHEEGYEPCYRTYGDQFRFIRHGAQHINVYQYDYTKPSLFGGLQSGDVVIQNNTMYYYDEIVGKVVTLRAAVLLEEGVRIVFGSASGVNSFTLPWPLLAVANNGSLGGVAYQCPFFEFLDYPEYGICFTDGYEDGGDIKTNYWPYSASGVGSCMPRIRRM